MLQKKDTSNAPRHVVLIPDGNRRWARQRGLSAIAGHDKGLAAFEDAARHAAERGIKYLSLWGMSLDNFTKRGRDEVAWLLNFFRREFNKLATDREIHERQTKISVLGRWHQCFPEPVVSAIREAQAATKNYNRHFLNFLLAYNGTDEMVQAVQAIVDSKAESVRVTPELIKQHLFTRQLPPVDLLIRAGGEPHLSNGFMMWDTADAQLYFTSRYWPDFDREEFDRALADFAARRRRRGR